jgi:hypothetical protein
MTRLQIARTAILFVLLIFAGLISFWYVAFYIWMAAYKPEHLSVW